MIRFMKENLNRIPDLVRIASGALHLSESVIEKDLWVTYFLDYLFSRCPYKDTRLNSKAELPFRNASP